MYEPKQYPKWLYHPTLQALIVKDESAHKALGLEWAESPADVKAPGPAPEKDPIVPVDGAEKSKHAKKVK